MLNRRSFLVGASAGLSACSIQLARSGQRHAANDRIAVGLIGAGIRGQALVKDMPADARIVAVCDCYQPRIDEVKRLVPQTKLREFKDYREMIEQPWLDAVIIAAPDHHHVLAAMLACRTGLDVYCEKPLSLTIGEGKALVKAVRKHGRVLQVGSQQRSMEWDQFACQFVREGGLGKLSYVDVQNWPGPLPSEVLAEEPMPAGFVWDLFLGQAPSRPHHWRYWLKDQREYNGARWRGWDMWRDYSGHLMTIRNGFTPIPRDLVPEKPDAALREKWMGQGFVARPHLQNWLDCIRSRQDPVALVEIGHRSATVCHLAGIARELKRKLRWDPVAESFPDDAEANALINRPKRDGWELPT